MKLHLYFGPLCCFSGSWNRAVLVCGSWQAELARRFSFAIHMLVCVVWCLLVWLLRCELLDPYSAWVLLSHRDATPLASQVGGIGGK